MRNLWEDLVTDPETTAQVVRLLSKAIQNEEVKRSVRELILEIVKDDEVYRELTNLVVDLGEEAEVSFFQPDVLKVYLHVFVRSMLIHQDVAFFFV